MAQKSTPRGDGSEGGELSQSAHEHQPHAKAAGDSEGAKVSPGVEDSERMPDTPQTRQEDDSSPFRHRYANARASDYAHDFQQDGSGDHPVKPVDSTRVDEDGIPDIAETRRPAERQE